MRLSLPPNSQPDMNIQHIINNEWINPTTDDMFLISRLESVNPLSLHLPPEQS